MTNIIHIKPIISNNAISIKAYIIDKCNFKCEYCYNRQPRLNNMLDLDYLYDFILYISSISRRLVNVELIGGEPMLHPKLALFCKKLSLHANINECTIYSNFSVNFEAYVNLLCIDKVNLYLSWHSTIVDRYNKQYIDNICKLNRCFDQSILKQKVFCIIMLEHKNFIEAIKAYKDCISSTTSDVSLALVSNTNAYRCQYLPYQMHMYYELIKHNSIYLDNNIYVVDNTGQQYKINDNQLAQMHLNFKNWKCNAGIDRLYVHCNGEVYPCQQYYESNMGSIGSIFNIDKLHFTQQICACNECNCEYNIEKTRK